MRSYRDHHPEERNRRFHTLIMRAIGICKGEPIIGIIKYQADHGDMRLTDLLYRMDASRSISFRGLTQNRLRFARSAFLRVGKKRLKALPRVFRAKTYSTD